MSLEAESNIETNEDSGEFDGLSSAAPENDESLEQQPTSQPQSQKPNYQPYVDLSGLPDETREAIEGRFAHLSRLQKKSETKREGELREWRDLASEQARRIDELTNGFAGMANHLQEKSYAETEAQLTEAMRIAFESGDSHGYINAQNKLLDIKADKKLVERQKKEAPAKVHSQQNSAPNYRNASELANDAVTDGDITHEEASLVSAWQEESDPTGNLLRPWAHNSTPHLQPDHPQADQQYLAAIRETVAVFDNPRLAKLTFDQKLAEVDRRMGTAKPGPKQNVMGGNLTGNRKPSKLGLSPEQEKLAVRLKLGGPKAKSDADHIAKYRQQLEKTKVGSRK